MSATSPPQSLTVYYDGHGPLASSVCGALEKRGVRSVSFAGDLTPWFSGGKEATGGQKTSPPILFLPACIRSAATPIERAVEFHQLVPAAQIVVWWPIEPDTLVSQLWPWAILVGSSATVSVEDSAACLVEAALSASARAGGQKRRSSDKTNLFEMHGIYGTQKPDQEVGRAA